jgi:hypothetical protein
MVNCCSTANSSRGYAAAHDAQLTLWLLLLLLLLLRLLF